MPHERWVFTTQRLRFASPRDFGPAWLELETRERAWCLGRLHKGLRVASPTISSASRDPGQLDIITLIRRRGAATQQDHVLTQQHRRSSGLSPAFWQAFDQAQADLDSHRPSRGDRRIARCESTTGQAGLQGGPCFPSPQQEKKLGVDVVSGDVGESGRIKLSGKEEGETHRLDGGARENSVTGGGASGTNTPIVRKGRHGVPIYRLPGLTDAQLRKPWLIARGPGERIDRLGQRWRKPRVWLPDWGHVLERPSWLEPVRVWEEGERAAARRVEVYGILGANGPGRWRARVGRLPRREFPPGAGRYDGVVGWRAQLVAWYVLRRWPELVWWRRWRRLGWDQAQGRVNRRAVWKRRPRLPARLRARLQLIAKGRAAWTARTEAEVAGAIEGARAALRAEVERRPPPRRPGGRMRVGLLTGRITR